METEETVPSESERSPIGAISERHVYKYRCAHCSLAFKTQDKLVLGLAQLSSSLSFFYLFNF